VALAGIPGPVTSAICFSLLLKSIWLNRSVLCDVQTEMNLQFYYIHTDSKMHFITSVKWIF